MAASHLNAVTEDAPLVIELEKNPDILAELGGKKGERVLVGFAAETENIAENGRAKLAAASP